MVVTQKSCASLYDFVGKVLETKSIHTANSRTDSLMQTMDYDHAGRLLEVKQQLNTEDEIVLLANDYNELGELIEKNLHSEDNGGSFAQSVDYRYNIRGWLTSINNAALTETENKAKADLFGLEVGYNNNLQTGNTPRYNGDASGIKWSTNLGLGDVKQRGYNYGYDAMSRLTSASHTSFIGGWQPVNPYGVTLGYDQNGNTTSLTRKNELGGNLDALTYSYTGNQAMRITDAGDKAKGFRDGHTVANVDDYDYDPNGNLKEDKNKGILRYSYNYLNLPDTVEFTDNKMIVFAYDATGIKLSQTNYENGTAITKRDYAAGYFYENDTLRYISTAEGRIIPVIASGSAAISYEYQYNIQDHLENNWLSFTTKPKQWEFLATMEDANASYEESTFGYVAETRTPSTAANNTPGGSKAAQLDINQPVGPVLSLQVAAGDTISIEAYGYYEGGSGYSSTNTAAAIIGVIAGAFGGVSGAVGEAGTIYNSFNQALGTAGFGGTNDDNVPAAYLNYLLFDQDNVYKAGGFKQITTNANMSSELVSFPSFVITQPGTIYIYCSNESENGRVFFDDLKITHNESSVVATNTYFPNGAPIAGLSFQRATTPVNRFKFIDREYVDDFGLDLYDHLARWYDPHWGAGYTGIDVLADEFSSWSPYQYAFRNPARYVDKTGMAPDDVTGGGPCGDQPCPEKATKIGDAGVTGSVKIGLAFGFSFKVGGENLSVFVDFGSVELASFNNSTINKGVKETEGIELGFGPVGIKSTVETVTETKNGELTKTETQTVGGNLFNVDMKEEFTTVTKNPGSSNKDRKSVV